MYFLAKYNTQTDFNFPMVKRGVVDLAVTGDWTPATGDTKISKDSAAVANTTNNPAIASGVSWKLTVTATELSAKWITIQIIDSATKAVEDQFLNILTYGNASAFFPAPDYQDAVRFGLTALPNIASGSAGAVLTSGTGTAQLNVTGGRGDADVLRWNGTAVTTPKTAGTPVVDWVPSGWRSNTAQAGAAGSITLDASASATTDFYKYTLIQILSGTGAGQARLCTAYNGGTKVATIVPNWTTNPDATSVFSTMPLAIADIESWLAVVPNALISGRVDANAQLVGDKTGYSLTQAFPTNFSTLSIDGSGRMDLAKWVGVAPNALITGRVDSNAQVVGDKTGYSLTQAFPANFSSFSIDGSGRVDIAKVIGSAINALISGKLDVISSLRTGTAQAGASTTITLDSGASATDNFYNNNLIYIASGTGANQARRIRSYVGSTKVATIAPAWTTNPDSSSVFVVIPDSSVWDEVTADHLGSGTTGNSLNAAGAAGDPWTTALPGAYGAGTAGKIVGTNLDATVSSRSTYAGADTAGTTTLLSRIASALTITSGKVDVNDKTGFSLSSAGIQAIWDALTSALTTSGSIGKRIADFLTGDAFVRLGAPSGASVSVDIASIKTDTGTTIPNLIAALNNLSAAQAKTQVVNAISVDTYAEPGQGTPAATTDLATKIGMTYKSTINKLDQTSALFQLYNNAATVVDQKATVSNDLTTFVRGKLTSGP